MKKRELQIISLSSLAKVFPMRIWGQRTTRFSAVRGQELSFQIAFRRGESGFFREEYSIIIQSPLKNLIKGYLVKNVPSILATNPLHHDQNYLTTQSGIFPDPLVPWKDGKVLALGEIWNALWFSIRIPTDYVSGEYSFEIQFLNSNGTCVASKQIEIVITQAVLPKQRLLYTDWFHCDCIAAVHNVKIFSEEHWRLIGEYMKTAADHGMNMILTPILTPPLDTAVGKYRPTVQLVEIEKSNEGYRFDFSRLERFIKLALRHGICTFEINHFFTQWGAAFAAKTIARVNGRKKRIFGWDTPADSTEYSSFLSVLIPATIAVLKSMGISQDHIYFHVSDEPNIKHFDSYQSARDRLIPLIGNCKHMDALSERSYYDRKLVEIPVVSNNHIEPWIGNTEHLWCYYCCEQTVDVSNRLLSMPSARTRIIGVQLYKYGIEGFLHWGYNFYYTALSKRLIDPWAETDAGQAFPSGDSFCVYPYGNTVIPSIRLKVFAEALQDIRMLYLLEEKIGRNNVISMIDQVAQMNLTFSQYPTDDCFFDRLYDSIFEHIN